MFLRMLERANFLITEYQIFHFPIPIETIEEIITTHNYKVVILQNLKSGSIIADNILIPSSDSACIRENMVHEYGHAINHCHNQFTSDTIQIAKNEAEAKAFAAYFLMPVYIFESDLKSGYNDYELSENFGVKVEFVQYRKTLTEQLIHNGYFQEYIKTR